MNKPLQKTQLNQNLLSQSPRKSSYIINPKCIIANSTIKLSYFISFDAKRLDSTSISCHNRQSSVNRKHSLHSLHWGPYIEDVLCYWFYPKGTPTRSAAPRNCYRRLRPWLPWDFLKSPFRIVCQLLSHAKNRGFSLSVDF